MRRVRRLKRPRKRFDTSVYDQDIEEKTVKQVGIQQNENWVTLLEEIGMHLASSVLLDPNYADEAPYYTKKIQKICMNVAKRVMFHAFRKWRQRWFFVTSERANVPMSLPEVSTGFMESIDLLHKLIERGSPQRVRGYLNKQTTYAKCRQEKQQKTVRTTNRPPRPIIAQKHLVPVDDDSLDEWNLENPRSGLQKRGLKRSASLTSQKLDDKESSLSESSTQAPVMKEDRGIQTDNHTPEETENASIQLDKSITEGDSCEDVVHLELSQSVSSTVRSDIDEEEDLPNLFEFSEAQTENVNRPSQLHCVEEPAHAKTSGAKIPEQAMDGSDMEEEDALLQQIEAIQKLLDNGANRSEHKTGMNLTQNPSTDFMNDDFANLHADPENLTVPN